MIYLFHGLGSDSNTSTTIKSLTKVIDSDLEIRTITYPWYDPENIESVVLPQIDPNDTQKVFIGVSLGGLVARYFANKYYGSTLILINPSLRPHITSGHHNGSTINGHTLQSNWNQLLSQYYVDNDNPSLHIHLIVGDSDTQVDPSYALNVYSDKAVHIIKGGTHALEITDCVASTINKAIHSMAE